MKVIIIIDVHRNSFNPRSLFAGLQVHSSTISKFKGQGDSIMCLLNILRKVVDLKAREVHDAGKIMCLIPLNYLSSM